MQHNENKQLMNEQLIDELLEKISKATPEQLIKGGSGCGRAFAGHKIINVRMVYDENTPQNG